MFAIIGAVTVVGCVIGGYMLAGGHLGVLWQPFEFLIILGAGIGAFLITNPMPVVIGAAKSVGPLLKGPKHNKASYLELLCMLYTIFKLAKTKGDLALESHVENPNDSSIFQKFPNFLSDHHSLDFFCDYLRLLTLGTSNAHEVESIIDAEIESHHNETHAVADAVSTLGDSLPALGIVAAVLGVIHTMGSITEPPEVLGHLIGGALVGTFFGILVSYGFVAPMGKALATIFGSESTYYNCMKAALIAHMQGYAPQVSVEFARKILPPHDKPTFAEVEEAISNIGA